MVELMQKWYQGVRPWSRHSLVLTVAGLAYIFIGLATYYIEDDGTRAVALTIARSWMPFEAWGFVFVIVGLCAMISARWPPKLDKWGYTLLTSLSAGWGAFYIMGVLFAGTPVSNLSGTAIYWLVAFMWWAISGLVNPEPKVIVVVSDAPRSS